jgi:hypothetical protein
MNKVDPKEPSMKTVAYTNSDVHILILLTPDKQTDSSKYDAMSTVTFKNNNYNSAFTQYAIKMDIPWEILVTSWMYYISPEIRRSTTSILIPIELQRSTTKILF